MEIGRTTQEVEDMVTARARRLRATASDDALAAYLEAVAAQRRVLAFRIAFRAALAAQPPRVAHPVVLAPNVIKYPITPKRIPGSR